MASYNSPRAAIVKSGLFSQSTLLIIVGPEREPFHIHPTQLANTNFFKVHGEPPTQAEKERQAQYASPRPDGAEAACPATPTYIKQETERSPTMSPDRRPSAPTETASLPMADYILVGQMYEPAAFETIVKWLYNQIPEVPKHRPQCKTLLRAYVLSLRYGLDQLQDIIVDNFRKYHQEFNVSLEDLLWLVNRIGDTSESHAVPMVRYYADQIAYEILCQGYDNFFQNNGFFETFLTEGDRPIRAVIFEAMARYTRNNKPVDPAMGPNRWRVQDRQSVPLRQEKVVEMVEIEED